MKMNEILERFNNQLTQIQTEEVEYASTIVVNQYLLKEWSSLH